MTAADLEPERLSDLQRGIRELFRIVVPGAFVLALLKLFTEQSRYVTALFDETLTQIAGVFFAGLFAYALRVHERWWPYFLPFESERTRLNNAIGRVLGVGTDVDHVEVYKYFLETRAPDLKERVHYFSSFYYMLTELSLIALIAGLARALSHLTDGYLYAFHSFDSAPAGTALASAIVAAALVYQGCLLVGLTGVRTKYARWSAPLPIVALAIALVILSASAVTNNRYSPLTRTISDPAVYVLFAVALAFGTLGVKQWRQVIGEQVFLVGDRAQELTAIHKRHSAAGHVS